MARDTEINVDVTVQGEEGLIRADRALNDVEQSAQDAGKAIDTTQRGFATIGQEAQQAGRSFTNFGSDAVDSTMTVTRGFDSMGRRIREVYRGTSPEAQRMSSEIRSAFAQQRTAMSGFRDDAIKSQYAYFKLAQSSKAYTGTTDDFISQIEKMGKADKKVKDNMMASNEMAKMSFYQSVGAMMARSSQASKIGDNFTRMANPMYSVNKPLLGIADGLNKIAMRGQPAALALKMLGPTANMKQLQDMTMMISQGMMRFTAVALIAAVAAGVFYGALHKGAMETSATYAAAFKTMTSTIRQTFQPLVEVFAAVMTPVYNFITMIGQMILKFQEAHPTITKLISAFMLLVPALTLILSPLAVGIGLFGGLGAALAAAAPLMMPVVTGFAAILGTVALVAVGIVALGAAFYLLWTRSETFKTGVITAWNAIKAAALAVWGFIAPYIQQAITAVTTFVQAKLVQLQAFWTANGASIMAAVSNVWNVVLTVIRAAMVVIVPIIQVAFMLVKSIIVSTWNAIKNVINGTIQVIMGIIQVFSGLLTGNFTQVWTGLKAIVTGALQTLWGVINLYFIGKFLGPLRSFGTMAMGIVRSAWAFIKGVFTSGASGIANVIRMYFNMYRSIITGVMNAIRSIVTAVWNALRSSVSAAVGSIRASIQSAFSSARSIVTNAMQAIKSVVTSVWNAVRSSVTSVLSGILSSVRSTFSNIISAITSAMSKVGSTIKSGFNSALSAVKAIGSSFYNAGRGLIEQMIGGISSMAGEISKTVSDVVGKVRDFLPFSPAKVGPLSDLDKLDFGGPISDSIDRAFPKVSAQMNMLMGSKSPQPVSPVNVRPSTYRPSMEASPAAIARSSSASTTNKNNITIQIIESSNPQETANSVRDALDEYFASMGRVSPRTTEV
ncbi:phage tail protein [Exiguobacterium antarcticum]|uniref:phage tail protein n=1 Tax=Exiguobacterium antarcticum TaxID=132920 RepID=UPI00047E111A|nr:hypothetical protein [Exiguobacterium antarcticum]